LTDTGRCFGPVFTADGERIVFGQEWWDPTARAELFSVKLDGSDLRQLTDRERKRAFAATSDPRGVLMVKSGRSMWNQIWFVGLDGTGSHRLPTGSMRNGASRPVLSPDRQTVFYVAEQGSLGYRYDLFSTRVRGDDPPERLTTEEAYIALGLSVSPDGRDLLFVLEQAGGVDRGKGEICTVPVAGGEVTVVGTNY